MDLTIKVDDYKLNIRVAVLVQTKEGYLFEKSSNGYCFTLGGRVKINESSLGAARREVEEEIGHKIGDIKLVSVIENFYTHVDSDVHEFCFVYRQNEIIDINLPDNFAQISEDDLASVEIKPGIIKKIIMEGGDVVSHHIVTNKER